MFILRAEERRSDEVKVGGRGRRVNGHIPADNVASIGTMLRGKTPAASIGARVYFG
jgi:hypothetical protein